MGQNMSIWQITNIGDTVYYLEAPICPGSAKECTSLRAVNKQGALLFDVFFDTLDLATYFSICSDQKYLYLNTIVNSGQNPATCVLLKLNSNGEVIKKINYKYGTSKFNFARSINLVGDSIAVCYSFDTIDQDTSYFLFFDKELNFGRYFKYQNKPLGSANETSFHLYSTLDGNYITNRGLFYAFGISKQIVKFKPSGEVIWEKDLLHTDEIISGQEDGLVIMPDSTFVYNHYRYNDNSDVLIDKWPVTISKISSDSKYKIWEYTFESRGHDLNNFLFKAKNNDIIGGGEHYIIHDEENIWNQINLGWIYRISNEGKLIWEKKIVDVNHNPYESYFNSGLELENGDLVFGGAIDTLFDPNNPKPIQNCWLVRVDSNGCISPGCLDTIFITSINYKDPLKKDKVIIYPNPGIDHITIQIPTAKQPESIKIVDVQGKIQLQLAFNVHLKIESLPAGIYNIIFYWADGKVATAGFVKI